MTDATPGESRDTVNESTASVTPPRRKGLPPALAGAYADLLRANTPSSAALDLVRQSIPQSFLTAAAREALAARHALEVALPTEPAYQQVHNDAIEAYARATEAIGFATPLSADPAYTAVNKGAAADLLAARQAVAASAPSWTSILAEQARLIDATRAPSWTSILAEQARLSDATREPLGVTALPPILTTRGPIPAKPAPVLEPPDTTVPDLLTDMNTHLANIVARTDADAMANAAAQKKADRATRTSNIVAMIGLAIGGAALIVAVVYH